MQICIVTDEISADPESAIELGVEWGIHDFELRGFDTARVPNFSDFQKQRLAELLEEYQARVVVISPGLFKCPFPSSQRERFPLRTFDQSLYQHWRDAKSLLQYHTDELLPASVAYAWQIGAEKIVIFSFERGSHSPEAIPDEVVETLHRASETAATAGLELVVEVEEGYWADTGRNAADFIQAVNHPSLGVNWDPGNAFAAGDVPFPTGYHAVRSYVRHVHFKDAVRIPGNGVRYVTEGAIDWAGQIAALKSDGYSGFVSIEPHMQPKIRSAKSLLDRLRQLISDA